jgi:DNA-binding response OmpR family regulator
MLSALCRLLGFASTGRPSPGLLVIEQDRRLRASLVRLFAERGLTAVVATDGTAALRYLSRSQDRGTGLAAIDVVIADVDAPGRSGLDLLAIVREKGWPVRMLMTSASVCDHLREEVVRNGASALLGRPCTARQWDRLLDQAVKGHA